MTEKAKTLSKEKAQVFPCELPVRCHIFCCNNVGRNYIGRPDGPINMCLVVCDDCLATIAPMKVKINECKHCGETFSTLQELGTHVRYYCTEKPVAANG